MPKKAVQRTIPAPKVAFAILLFASLLLALWLLLGGGQQIVGGWFGKTWIQGDPIRRIALATAFTVYFIRLLFTIFVFQRRSPPWAAVLGIGFWVLFIYLFLTSFGGTNVARFGLWAGLGIFLFAAGSGMNSYAEYARHMWTTQPQHEGRLYTAGLFHYTRHPNYLGDVLSFSGLSLIAGAWATAIIPLIMLAGFVFINIPMLDAHLREHYGDAFDRWARRTSKLIPFVY